MFTSPNRDTLTYDTALEVARDRAADEAFQRYLDWRRQSSTCESAYRHWAAAATSRDGALAFATYLAALDREERAAAQYAAALFDDTDRCGS